MRRDILKNRIVRNSGWLIGGKVLQMAISLVVSLLTARYLGPSNYGLINYAAAYTGFFTAFCNLGISYVLVKELVDSPENEGQLMGTTLILRLISSTLSAIMIICLVCVLDAGEPTTILVVALSCIGMVFHVFDTFNYWFQWRLQSKVCAIATFVAYVITAAYKLILLATGKSVIYFAFATSVDHICIAVMLLIAYKNNDGTRMTFSRKWAVRLLKKGFPYILPTLMGAIYTQVDKFMLKQIISEAEIGFYSTAVTVSGLWCFVIAAIIDSVYPSLLEANKANDGTFIRKNKTLYAIVFYVCIGVSVVITILAEVIINILYGKAYHGAVNPLRILTWYTAFAYLGVARQAWIVCNGKEKYLVHIYVISAAVNVVLNLILIPYFGASGAAVATLMTQIATVFAPYLIKGMRENAVMMAEAILLRGVFAKKE